MSHNNEYEFIDIRKEASSYTLPTTYLVALAVRFVLRCFVFTDDFKYLKLKKNVFLYLILRVTHKLDQKILSNFLKPAFPDYELSAFPEEVEANQAIGKNNIYAIDALNELSSFLSRENIDRKEDIQENIETRYALLRCLNSIFNSGIQALSDYNIEIKAINTINEDFNNLEERYSKSENNKVDDDFFEEPLWGKHSEKDSIQIYFQKWNELEKKEFKVLRPFIESEPIDWNYILDEYKEWLSKEKYSNYQIENFIDVATMYGSGLSEKDLLGRQRLINTLSNMIVSEAQETPFVIGLFGDWGAGKSNLMYFIEKNIIHRTSERDYYFAHFNAWEYEKTDSMSAGVGQEVIKGFTEDLDQIELMKLKFKFGLNEYGKGYPIIFISVILTFLITWVSGIISYFNPSFFSQLIFIISTSFLIPLYWKFIKNYKDIIEHPLSTKFWNYVKLPDYDEYLGAIPTLKKHMRTLCNLKLENDNDRLIVFVDDLDRCGPASITRTLHAIRLVMDINKVIVVIGIDHRIAFRAVEKHYDDYADEKRTATEIARDYLGKIIQLPVILNKPSDESLKSYITQKLFKREELIESEEKQSKKLSEPKPESEDGEIDQQNFSAENDFSNKSADSTNIVAQRDDSTESENPSVFDFTYTVMSEDDEEVENFSELTSIFDFSNPRQLIRLRNCYRLFKGTRPNINRKRALNMLFWLEYLYSINKEKRENIIQYLKEENKPYIDLKYENILPNRIYKFIHQEFSSKTDYEDLKRKVESFVLPIGHS